MWTFEVTAGPHLGLKVVVNLQPIGVPILQVGRNPPAPAVTTTTTASSLPHQLLPLPLDKEISGHHATLMAGPDGSVIVEERGSTNGTKVLPAAREGADTPDPLTLRGKGTRGTARGGDSIHVGRSVIAVSFAAPPKSSSSSNKVKDATEAATGSNSSISIAGAAPSSPLPPPRPKVRAIVILDDSPFSSPARPAALAMKEMGAEEDMAGARSTSAPSSPSNRDSAAGADAGSAVLIAAGGEAGAGKQKKARKAMVKAPNVQRVVTTRNAPASFDAPNEGGTAVDALAGAAAAAAILAPSRAEVTAAAEAAAKASEDSIADTQEESPGEARRRRTNLLKWLGPGCTVSSEAVAAAAPPPAGGISACGSCSVPVVLGNAWRRYVELTSSSSSSASSSSTMAISVAAFGVFLQDSSDLVVVSSRVKDVELEAVSSSSSLTAASVPAAAALPPAARGGLFAGEHIAFPRAKLRPELAAANCRLVLSPGSTQNSARRFDEGDGEADEIENVVVATGAEQPTANADMLEVGQENAGAVATGAASKRPSRLWKAAACHEALVAASSSAWRKNGEDDNDGKGNVRTTEENALSAQMASAPAADAASAPSPPVPVVVQEEEAVAAAAAAAAPELDEQAFPSCSPPAPAPTTADAQLSTPELLTALAGWGVVPGSRKYMEEQYKALSAFSPRPEACYVPAPSPELKGDGMGKEGDGDAGVAASSSSAGIVANAETVEGIALLFRRDADLRRRALMLQPVEEEELLELAEKGGVEAEPEEIYEAAKQLGVLIAGR